jgi:hypothetical protein
MRSKKRLDMPAYNVHILERHSVVATHQDTILHDGICIREYAQVLPICGVARDVA